MDESLEKLKHFFTFSYLKFMIYSVKLSSNIIVFFVAFFIREKIAIKIINSEHTVNLISDGV